MKLQVKPELNEFNEIDEMGKGFTDLMQVEIDSFSWVLLIVWILLYFSGGVLAGYTITQLFATILGAI